MTHAILIRASFLACCISLTSGCSSSGPAPPCNSDPWLHGSCTNSGNTYTCSCNAGWSGQNCDFAPPCNSDPCLHGSCTNSGNTYTCSCYAGWSGRNCDVALPCHSGPCVRGRCTNVGSTYRCSCPTGWSGNTCNVDINECFNNPCIHGMCQNTRGSYYCSCDQGWEGSRCQTDINECLRNNPCQHGTCRNTRGGYLCICGDSYYGLHCESACMENCARCSNALTCNVCNQGYEVEDYQCVDVNECIASSSPCIHGTCFNENGGFRCECLPGYEGSLCERDTNECINTPGICNHGDCMNTDGGYECQCHQGWEQVACDRDINECSRYHPCVHGRCENTDGSYTCTCDPGYDGLNCDQDLNVCLALPCAYGECVDETGPAFNCFCDTGFTGELCNQDVDECRRAPCVNGVCTNTEGSFNCTCHAGWQGLTCDLDIDECSINNPCIHGFCNNTQGGYECTCGIGYTGRHCTSDCIPNCEVCGNGTRCTECFPGYHYSTAEVCEDDDECNDSPCIHGTCQNFNGGYTCDCFPGWTGDLCDADVDECYFYTCEHGECTNFLGSYECDCHPGYYGNDCDSACSDHCATCISQSVCINCMDGYQENRLGQCTDFNECVTLAPCVHGICIDTDGGYECNCTGTGYQGHNCDQDVVECDTHPCLYGQCMNTVGSYRCVCDIGYTRQNCDADLDECEEHDPCEHGTCRNYDGGYQCECHEGWTGDGCDENIDECAIEGFCNKGRCRDLDGSYKCNCNGLYNGSRCEYDIDECLGDACVNGICVNLKGSFRCDCNEGYYGTRKCIRYPKARLYDHGREHDPNAIKLDASDIWQNHCVRLKEWEMFDINCERFDRICVSPHGLISLGRPYLGFASPQPISHENGMYLIAALHTFNQGSPDGHESGVWISKYSKHDGKLSTTYMFDRFQNEINQLDNSNFPRDFEPTLAIIVTYNNMTTFPYREDKPKNTFQIALLSDTDTHATLVIIKYGDLRTRLAIPNTAGIQVPRSREKTKQHRGAGTDQVFKLHVKPGYPENKAIENQAGEYFYVTNHPDECPVKYWKNAQRCWKSYQEYLKIPFLASHLGPTCFCNRYSSIRRGRFSHRGSCATANFFMGGRRYIKECCFTRSRRWPSYRRWYKFRHIISSDTVYEAGGRNHLNDMRRYCCAASTESCNLYKRVRDGSARKRCRSMSRWEIRYANGDPHLVTGDGIQYSFQGVGEYVYAESELFSTQVRMVEYKNSGGEGIQASIITAVVMKAGHSNTIQVETNGTDLVITSYPQHPSVLDLSQWFVEAEDMESLTYPGNLIMLTKLEQDLAVNFLEAETELKIQAGGFGDLSLALSTAERESGYRTRGLIGLMNGDPSDDFMTPDNITLSANSTEETIYWEFGQKWLVNQDNTAPSMFIYPAGKMSTDFTTPPEYMPRFHLLANQTEERKTEIDLACGNSMACKYDLAATGDEEFALKRLEFEQLIDDIWDMSNFEQPQIHAPSQVHATLGQELEFTVSVESADSDTFEFLTYLPDDVEFTVNDTVGVVRWTPQNHTPVYGLTFGGSGSGGYPAQMVTVNVLLCDCSEHGDCLFDFLQQTTFDNETFALVHCDCHRGYTGDFCSDEVDACTDSPCIPGSQCTDMSAEEEQTTGRAFTCTGCPQGYEELDGFCVEVDECEEAVQGNETLCNPSEHSQCINIIGSYECICNHGFMMSSSSCVDKDECSLYEHSCTQLCINTPGSYRCGCVEHYVLQGDGKTCLPDSNAVTPCLEANLCSDYCADETHCGCRPGMTLDDQTNCIYNQECALGTHECDANAVCIYNFPGYRCECLPGYTLNDDSRTCTACRPGFWGHECEEYCFCATSTTPCLPDTGCVECPTGWNGGSCSEDIDECSDNPELCGNHGNCTNSVGTYLCECEEGYGWNIGDAECAYIDYCDVVNKTGDEACHNGGVCVHHLGGFSCNCTTGYMGDQCQQDIDECSSSPCLNDGYCQDQIGSYACICQVGFRGENCEEDIDECMSNPCLNGGLCVDQPGSFDCHCSYPWSEFRCTEFDSCHSNPCVNNGTCIDLPDTYQCVCTSGWEGERCEINIDECALDTDGCSQLCTDTDGAYECSCTYRYALGEDLRSCIADDICVPNAVFCDEEQGYCIDGRSCGCNHGYSLIEDNVCVDTDECAINSHRCDEHGDCINEIGGYRCACHHGYALQNNRRSCTMIDWCVESTPVNKCLPGAQCVPEVGGFSCVCLPGLTGEYCEIDIDGCLSDPCYNGAYCEDGRRDSVYCSCRSGFYGELCDGDYDECRSNPCQNGGTCEDLPGGYTCICIKGFTGANCENDLRECESAPCVHGTCIDMVGGYQCSCAQLYGGRHCDHKPCALDPCNSNGICYISSGENNQYRCECGALYEGDHCEIELEAETLETADVSIFLKLSGDFVEELRNHSSIAYMSFTKRIKSALKSLLVQHVTKDFVDVSSFRYEPGSIIIECNVVLLQSTSITEDLLVETIQYVVDKHDGVLPGMEDHVVLVVKKHESSVSHFNYMWLAVGLSATVILTVFCVTGTCCLVKKYKALLDKQRIGSTTQLVGKDDNKNANEEPPMLIKSPKIQTVQPAMSENVNGNQTRPQEKRQSLDDPDKFLPREISTANSTRRPSSQASNKSVTVSLIGVTLSDRKNSQVLENSVKTSDALPHLDDLTVFRNEPVYFIFTGEDMTILFSNTGFEKILFGECMDVKQF